MKASNHLLGHVPDGSNAITLETCNDGLVMLVGSTVLAGVDPRRWVSSFTVTVPREESGLVAVSVSIPPVSIHFDSREEYSFFIPFYWEDGKLQVERDKTWVPPNDRLGQITNDHVMVTTSEGVRYTSNHKRKNPGDRHVPDANLLCRFLVGQADIEEVEAAASAWVEEVSLQQRVAELEGKLELAQACREDGLEASQMYTSELEEKLCKLAEKKGELSGQIDLIRMATDGHPYWVPMRKIREHLWPESEVSEEK